MIALWLINILQWMHLRLHKISLVNGSTTFVSFGDWVNWQSGHSFFFYIYFFFPSIWRLNCCQVIHLQQTANDSKKYEREFWSQYSYRTVSFHFNFIRSSKPFFAPKNLSFILLSKHELKTLKASKLTASSWINMSNPTLLKMTNTSCTFIPRLFAVDNKNHVIYI